jgi:uncharacterized protein DUF4175
MEQSQSWPGAQSKERVELLGAVHGVRTRWKLRRALLGAALAIAGSLIVLAVLAYTLNAADYGDRAVMVGQIIAGVTVVGLFAWFVIRPMLPRPSDAQMALFIEERVPTLDASLVTAVELDARERSTGVLGRSPALAMRLFQSARDRIRKIDDARAVDRRALNQSVLAFATMATLAFVLTLAGPRILKHGMKLLLTPWDRAQPASLYAILVEPGDATVARGGDQLVAARLYGFQSDSVDLLVRRADSTGWTRVVMTRDTTGGRYTFRLLDIAGAMDYVVESNNIRSRVFHLGVADLPYVRTMRHEYRFPAYTQLAPKVIEDGSDIVALGGTVVRVKITPTRPAVGGRIVLDHGDTVGLAAQSDGTLEGALRISRPGFYKVELRTADGRTVPASLDYSIDVLPDRPPTVGFNKPGHDSKVLAVDEVYTEVKAEDDYGVQRVDLVYSVNGGPEKTIRVHENTGKNLTDLAAGHTLMLEDFKLEPGDVISYYARAYDNNAVSGAQTATTDIYFLQVRPYEQDYRQQQSNGGAGSGGNQDNPGSLSQRERDIIAATFKTTRDKAITAPKDLEENLATIRLSQQRLREDVDDLTRRLNERGIAARDSDFKKISDILAVASATMDSAEKALGANDPQPALPPEQRALKHLQHAEAVYKDVQIRMANGGGGGGGGAQQQRPEDLADLFDLNRDKLRNQYESVQRGQQQQQQQQAQMDETLERLKKLAARQQQENERALRKMDSLNLGASGSGGGGSQRQMAQEAEQAARQLERLARERQSQELQDAARRLQDAADAMRRAAASGQQGAAEGRAAQQRLEEARRLLENERNNSFGNGVQNALETARRLREQEKQVASEIDKLNGADGSQRTSQLAETKGQMADAVRSLRNQLDRMSLDNRREQKETAQKLGEAAQALRDSRLEDRIRQSQQYIRQAPPEIAKQIETPIQASIEDLAQRLESAARSAEQGGQAGAGQRQAQAADRARDLVNGVESMAERMRQRQDANRRLGQGGTQGDSAAGGGRQQNGRAQNGQQNGQQNGGQSAQRGQQGNQSSGSQRGAQGQQGQGQQGQGQQGQGQQGQGQSRGQQGGQQNGQGGQQGEGSRQGGQSGQMPGRSDTPATGGMPNGGGRLSPDDARQFGREMRERLSDAEALRRDLQREGMNTSQLDRAIQGMRSLATENLAGDENAVQRLKDQVLEGLKGFEFDLRRALSGADGERVLLGRSGDVPEGYRQFVEEYYRSLAGGKTKKP